jgi:hypothetical protein
LLAREVSYAVAAREQITDAQGVLAITAADVFG